MSSDRYIDGLLEYAKSVLMYGVTAGLIKDDALSAAIAGVERLNPRTAGDPTVVTLHSALVAVANLVPPETRIALRPRSWFGGQEWSSSLASKISLIVFSVMLMIVTGRMTYIHNEGVSVAQELESLTQVDPERVLNEMVWDLAQASDQMQSVAAGSSEALPRFELALHAQETLRSDLKTLSHRVAAASSASAIFLNRDSRFPFWPTRWVYCESGVFQRDTVGHLNLCRSIPVGNVTVMLTQSPGAGCEVAPSEGGSSVTMARAETPWSPDTQTMHSDYERQMTVAETELLCDGDLSLSLQAVPALRPDIPLVNDRVELYAFWFLPALYGAMGVVIYQLRLVLDPMRPNRPWYRFAHRIVLGGLAGIVLGWFFAPSSQLSTHLADIGFGLFGLAFLFGYSIDVFFALLDRLVSVSVGSIEKYGGTRPAA